MTRSSNRPNQDKPPLKAYLSFDAVRFAIAWCYLSSLTRLQLVLRWLAVRLHGSTVRARHVVTEYWYRNVTRFLDDRALTFMNYGYVDLDDSAEKVELLDLDEPDRVSIQLYHHVVGAIDLSRLDVLEVSCGHGGGASYVMRYLAPRSVVAVDLNPNAVDWCRRRIRVEGLTFSECDAQALAFEANAFDAVVNIEASHCYPEIKRFLNEVHRVLRPGGHFLFADVRMGERACELLHDELVHSGLELVRREDISANVVRALELDSERRLDLVTRLAPRILRRYFMEWAAVEGSSVYESFRTGEWAYMSYALRKPASRVQS